MMNNLNFRLSFNKSIASCILLPNVRGLPSHLQSYVGRVLSGDCMFVCLSVCLLHMISHELMQL